MFCQKCANKLLGDAKFCNKCGAKVNGVSTDSTSMTGNLPASALQRLSNYLLDRILGGIVSLAFLVAIWGLVRVLPISQESSFVQVLNAILPVLISMSFIVNPLYYLFFEGIWQRTLGKWITKTKVVRYDGTKPHFLQILGRSFARWIPFEAFSFLFSNNPIGWHDRLSKTLVVPSNFTEEDVKNISFEEAKKQKTNTLLTIIAIVGGLLIIIAIIGILASVVLASLNSARQKGADASIKANLSSARAQAELYYDSNEISYYGVCTSSEGILSMYNSAAITSGSDVVCNDSVKAWAMSSPLKTNPDNSWCVDSLGTSKEIIGEITPYTQISCSSFNSSSQNPFDDLIPTQQSSKLSGAQICARDIPNSTWDGKSYTSDGSYECSCKNGYNVSSTSNKCVSNNQICSESFPNTYSRGIDPADGKNICDCKSGYAWNDAGTACY